MPPRGGKKGRKRARQYEHVKESLEDQGRSENVAEEIAARTVNKERARHGEARTASRSAPRGGTGRGGRGGEGGREARTNKEGEGRNKKKKKKGGKKKKKKEGALEHE